MKPWSVICIIYCTSYCYIYVICSYIICQVANTSELNQCKLSNAVLVSRSVILTFITTHATKLRVEFIKTSATKPRVESSWGQLTSTLSSQWGLQKYFFQRENFSIFSKKLCVRQVFQVLLLSLLLCSYSVAIRVSTDKASLMISSCHRGASV